MRAQSLGVAQHGPGQAEGAHPHDGHQQGQDRRAGRGLHDQPPRRRGQRDTGCGGEGGQDRADTEPGRRRGRRRADRRRRSGRPAGSPAVRGCGVTSGSASRHALVGEATSAGRWATTTTAPRRPSSTRVSVMTFSVSSSRWAVGSSSSIQGGPRPRCGPGPGEPARRPTGWCRPHPEGSPVPVAGPDPLLERDLVAARSRAARERRRVGASAGCRRCVPRTKWGRWGSQATCSCHAGPPDSVAVRGDLTTGEWKEAGQRVEQRRLAAAARAGHDSDAGRGSTACRPVTAGRFGRHGSR